MPLWLGFLLVVIASAVIAFLLAYLVLLPRAAYGNPNLELEWHDCSHCLVGLQWWDGSDWVPIPYHVRQIVKETQDWRPPQGNIRSCTNCMGAGGWWYEKDKAISKANKNP